MIFYNLFFFDLKIDFLIEKPISRFLKKMETHETSEKIAESAENANLPRIPRVYVEGHTA